MDGNSGVLLIAVASAGLGIVSTVIYLVLKWKEISALREIRDKLRQNGPPPQR